MRKNAGKAEQEEMLRISRAVLEGKRNECGSLEKIIAKAERGLTDSLCSKVIKFLGEQELNFLEAKKLSYVIEAEKAPSIHDFEKMGTTENFPCFLEKSEDVWTFFLPPTPSVKNSRISANIGKYEGFLVKSLIKKYQTEHGKITMLTSPVIVLEFGLKESTPLSKYYDADNRDNKRIIDAMTGTFFKDDNVLNIKTFHFGSISDMDYTKAYVMESEHFPLWYAEHFHNEE